MERKMIEPKIRYEKVYPELTLKPESYKMSKDDCRIIFKEDYIELVVCIDGSGNLFRLPYQSIKGIMK